MFVAGPDSRCCADRLGLIGSPSVTESGTTSVVLLAWQGAYALVDVSGIFAG